MKKPSTILLMMLCAAISVEGCVSLPTPAAAATPVVAKSFCDKVHVPAPFPKKARIDLSEERISYDDGGMKLLQEYAATREALQAACPE